MVIDASVWVAALLTHDSHHDSAIAFLKHHVANGLSSTLPSLALPEIAGAIARQTDSAQIAERAVSFLLDQSWITFVSLDDELANEAAAIAVQRRLRGADAVYVAVAKHNDGVLITLDREMTKRSAPTVEAISPQEWLKRAN